MPYKVSQCISYHHPAKDNVVKFYRDVIGLEVVSDNDDMAELSAGPVRLFVDKRDRQQLVMELIVDDLEAAREELVAAGCQVICWEGKGKDCYIRDPFGQMFNLWLYVKNRQFLPYRPKWLFYYLENGLIPEAKYLPRIKKLFTGSCRTVAEARQHRREILKLAELIELDIPDRDLSTAAAKKCRNWDQASAKTKQILSW